MIFSGTGQTNILALCYLLGKTYKRAHSSAPLVTEINKLDQITEKVIDGSTHIPLKALMIHVKRVKLRGDVRGCAAGWGPIFTTGYYGVAFSTELLEWGRKFSDFWGK